MGKETVARTDYKAPGGKLVRVATTVDDTDIIRRVEITGDFFLLPEEGLQRLEELLVGTRIEEGSVCNIVDEFFTEHHARGLGVTRDDFVKAIMACKEDARTP